MNWKNQALLCSKRLCLKKEWYHQLIKGLTLFCLSSASHAGLIHEWNLNNSVVDTFGGPDAILSDPTGLGTTGYTSDLTEFITIKLGGVVPADNYTVVLGFTLTRDNIGYQKIIDFHDRQSDNGLYAYGNYFKFYGTTGVNTAKTFTANSTINLLVSRNSSTDVFSAYLNGELLFSFVDSNDDAVLTHPEGAMHFFKDDIPVPGEDAEGFVDYIRFYDEVFTPDSLPESSPTAEPEEPEPSKPGLPPLPPTMTLNVDTSSLGLDYVDVYWGRNYPGSDSRIGSCKQDDTCTFTVETATWITLKPFAATGYQFKNQWGESSSCSNGNPFMVSSVTCKPGFSKLPPEAPVVLSATGVSDSQIDLIWRDNSTRETGYIIERSSDQTTWIEIARTLADATTHSDLGLACDATYHYRVTAYNISGQSAPSNIGSAVIACPVVPPPVTPPPVVDPVPPPVVPPTPPTTEPTPPTPPTEPTTPPPGPETPPTEPPVTEPTEPPTTPTEEPTVPVDETPVEPTTPPEPPVVPEPPVEPPVQPADSSDRPQGTETSTELPCPSDRHYNIHLDEACDAEGQTIENFKVVHGGSLANAIITGKLLNEGGLVSNLTLESTAVSEGGYVTNVMINKGLMKNFIFVGQQIKGGKLAGKIIIASKVLNEIRDVILVAGTVIQGKIGKEFAIAKLAGKIKGDAANPALLENVTIADGAELENVVLGEGVILGQNVKQKNVVMVCTTQRANGKGFNSGGFPFDDDQTCFAAQENAVALTLNPDSDLIGQTAEQLFVVIHGQKAFMFTHEWQEWNGELAGLDSAQSLTISAIQTIAFPELSSFEGGFKFFVGLRLKNDGTIVYHQMR